MTPRRARILYPRLPFASSAAACQWVARLVNWYNGQHRQSAIRYVTPDQRHAGADVAILRRRRLLHERVRRRTPARGPARFETGHPSPLWYSIRSPLWKDLMRHPDERDNYLDAHRRNELLPMAQEGQAVHPERSRGVAPTAQQVQIRGRFQKPVFASCSRLKWLFVRA